MALTPDEQAELTALEAKRTGTAAPAIPEPVQPATAPEMRQQATGAFNTLLEGSQLGFGGEMAGVRSPLSSPVLLPAQIALSLLNRPVYEERRERFDEPREAFAEERPYTALGLEIAGGAPAGLGAARAAQTAYAASRPLLTAMGIGAGTAAIEAAGKAETAAEAPQAALEAAPLGAAAGGVAPMLLSGLARTGAAVGRGVQGLLPRAGGRGAQRAADLAELDELSPSQLVARMRQMGPESRLADVGGPNIRERAEIMAVQPGRTSAVAQDFLESRQAQAIPRIEQAMQRLTGQSGQFLAPYRQLLQRRATEAAPYYNRARRDNLTVAQMEPLLRHLDVRIDQLSGSKVGRALSSFRRSLFREDGVIKTNVGDELHAVKMDLDDAISTRLRAGNRSQARELTEAKNQLLRIMDNSADYAQGRRIYSDESSIIRAAEAGRNIFRGDVEELVDDVSRMSDSERDAYLMGAARALRSKLAGEGAESGAAQRLRRNVEVRERLRTAFPDEGAYQDFMRVVETEQDYARLFNRIMNQSATAQRMAAGEIPTSQYQIVDRVAKWAMRNIGTDPQQVVDELGQVLWEFGPDQIERALRENRLSATAVRSLMEQVRGAAALAGGQAAAIQSEQ